MSDDRDTDAAYTIARNVLGIQAEDLPARVVDTTRRVIFDTVGCTIAGSGAGEGAKTVVALVEARGGKPEATILGHGTKVPSWEAALANGALAHALDFDDIHTSLPVHLSAFTVPAALAVAEAEGGVSGPDLIAAVALGNEVATRIGLAMLKPAEPGGTGWHPTLVPAYFSATVVAGKLLGLTETQMLDAFGITLYRTAGTMPFRGQGRHLVEEIYYGFPPQVGVLSAYMAKGGITGPSESFEGAGSLFAVYFEGRYERDYLTEGWGATYEGLNVALKLWPSNRGTHGMLEAAFAMLAETGVRAEDIDAIELHRTVSAGAMVTPRPDDASPSTGIAAKLSLPFCVATAFVRGRVDIADFVSPALQDPDVLALAARTTTIPTDGPAFLRVRTTSGELHTKPVPELRGTPERPMTDDELAAKFRSCTAHAARPIGPDGVERGIELLTKLEAVPDVAAVVSALT